ncbi:Hypothetical protein R9X50_00029100 [Acrodontium crateriforme]|uniref:Uncharacterized protein n=1 Tax=Acrodontium crateriforme TaxID=150365 RepID=A0AAQ3LYJ5_9PEZI|nr:Hypothetical protein R9X50_00029100 [Acrodontium crateriforme]
MALKRKRSSAAVTSPFSDCSERTQQSSASLAIPNFYNQSKPIEPLHQKPTWAWPTYEDEPTQPVNSRTRKRHRDDRPDEQTVYENTISKLFNAQRNQLNALPTPSHLLNPPTNAIVPQSQRSTLHAFWHINQQPEQTRMAVDSFQNSTTSAKILCSDCDRAILPDDAMELENELVEQEAACHNCRWLVCDGCAVLGDQRICLTCMTNGGR